MEHERGTDNRIIIHWFELSQNRLPTDIIPSGRACRAPLPRVLRKPGRRRADVAARQKQHLLGS